MQLYTIMLREGEFTQFGYYFVVLSNNNSNNTVLNCFCQGWVMMCISVGKTLTKILTYPITTILKLH